MVVVRATTAKRSHSSSPSVSTTTVSELPTSATAVSATRMIGMARRQVMANITTSSTRPPKKPPSMPSVMPMAPETSTVTAPISSEMRAPTTSRAR